MIRGVVAGFRTLVWAGVLLIFIIFVVATVLRQAASGTKFLGRDGESNETVFPNLPSTMFLLFRMSIGDSDWEDGTPLATLLYREFGLVFAVPYIIGVLFVTFGVFNMVMALFVETVL